MSKTRKIVIIEKNMLTMNPDLGACIGSFINSFLGKSSVDFVRYLRKYDKAKIHVG